MTGRSSFRPATPDLRAEKARRTSEIAEQLFLKHFDPADMHRPGAVEQMERFIDCTVVMARRIVDKSYDGGRG